MNYQNSPAYWRSFNIIAAVLTFIGLCIVMGGNQTVRQSREFSQAVDVQCPDMPCTNADMQRAVANATQSFTAQAGEGSIFADLGWVLFVGAAIAYIISAISLKNIQNEVTDYVYQQMRGGTATDPGVGSFNLASLTPRNPKADQQQTFCPKCNHKNKPNDSNCTMCGAPL